MWKIFIVSFLVSFALGQSDISQYGPLNLPHIQDCNVPCVLNKSEPACAFDGTRFNIYNDECETLKANCTYGYKLIPVEMQECITPRSFSRNKFCDFPCPNIERPICGRNEDRDTQLFKNGCVMARKACLEKSEYKEVNINMCRKGKNGEKCDNSCPTKYEPKCAYNGEEYSIFGNECDLEVVNCLQRNAWSPVRMTICNKNIGFKLDLPQRERDYDSSRDDSDIDDRSDEDDCPRVCKRVFWPICGRNGYKHKIFSNECLLKKEQCNGRDWEKTDMSDCLTSNLH